MKWINFIYGIAISLVLTLFLYLGYKSVLRKFEFTNSEFKGVKYFYYNWTIILYIFFGVIGSFLSLRKIKLSLFFLLSLGFYEIFRRLFLVEINLVGITEIIIIISYFIILFSNKMRIEYTLKIKELITYSCISLLILSLIIIIKRS